jgi:D-ribose pyranase
VARGVPQLDEVLQAVLSEMQVEGIVIADEALDGDGDTKKLPGWYPQSLGIEPQTVSHEEFKRRTAKARAMVRTGECTPYANIILIAGVKF